MEKGNTEFEKLIKENLEALNDIELIFLKGHLVIEQLLNQLLELTLREPQRMKSVRPMFNNKLEIYLSIEGNWIISEGLEKVLKKMNSLRNILAHNLSHPQFSKELIGWIEYASRKRFENREDIKEVREKLINAISSISAYLDGAIKAKKIYKK